MQLNSKEQAVIVEKTAVALAVYYGVTGVAVGACGIVLAKGAVAAIAAKSVAAGVVCVVGSGACFSSYGKRWLMTIDLTRKALDANKVVRNWDRK